MSSTPPPAVPAADDASLTAEPDRLQKAKGFIFDMDGVLYVGSRPLPGVVDLVNQLNLRGVPFLFATNNSMATPAAYVERLAGMGVEVEATHIQTSATATRDFLKDSPDIADDAMILPVGMPALAEQLTLDASFRILPDDGDPATADLVVAGLDLTFTYEKMRRAVQAIEHGARFIATNNDDRLPNESGYQPGAGAITAGIERASRVSPIVVGKPEPLMMKKGVDILGLLPEEVVMVGDRLDTDIASAAKAGLGTILVLTGLSRREDLATAEFVPDYVFPDLPSLLQAFIGHG